MPKRHYAHWPSGLQQALDLPTATVVQQLDATVERFTDKPCIIYYDAAITYRDFQRESMALAGWLQRRAGVGRGDRVILYLQNSPQFAIAYYAILRVGGVVVPVNPMCHTSELAHYIEDAQVKVVVAAQELMPHVAPLLDNGSVHSVVVAAYSDYLSAPTDLPVPEAVLAPRDAVIHSAATHWSDAVQQAQVPIHVAQTMDDLCVMPYTSGTTGKPKGCIHTHRSVAFTAQAGMLWLQMQPKDVVMAAVPLFHVTGMQRCLNGPLTLGNTVVIMSRWDSACAARLIERHRVTTWTGVPTMFIDLLGNSALDAFDLSSLQRIGGGGSAMPEAIAQRMRDRLGIPYIEGYGLSETIAPSHINPPHRPKKQCLGIPIFNTDARVITPDSATEVSNGEVGEIVISGPQVFAGYWNNPQATAQAFVELDGQRFFRTGDLGYIDEDGYFFMVDRLKRMINASGFKVWPAEVEALFYRHPAVQEVCVVGYPDGHRGESVKAIVVLKADQHADADTLIQWARSLMAAYKVPRRIEFTPVLPKSETGKIQWRLLQQQALSGVP